MTVGQRILPKMQSLQQKSDRDCGVCVFAKLTGMTEEQVIVELPDAYLGTVTVNGWEDWLRVKGFKVTRRDGYPDDIVPCAHLLRR